MVSVFANLSDFVNFIIKYNTFCISLSEIFKSLESISIPYSLINRIELLVLIAFILKYLILGFGDTRAARYYFKGLAKRLSAGIAIITAKTIII